MTTMTRNRGIEIGRGSEMAQVLEDLEQAESTEAEEYWTTPAFLVPAVIVRMPRRGRRG